MIDEYEDAGAEGFADGGWAEDEEFDYDEFIEENFQDQLTNTETKPIWRLVAVGLLVLVGGYFAMLIYAAWMAR